MATEPVCAGLLARARTKQDIADLREAVDTVTQIVEAGPEAFPDASRWSHATSRFPELILQRCGNITLGIQGAVLAAIVAPPSRLKLADAPPNTPQDNPPYHNADRAPATPHPASPN